MENWHGTRSAGILIRVPYAESVDEAIQTFVFPICHKLPCGNEMRYMQPEDVPRQTTPCPCGDTNHWFVKIEVDPSLDRREDKSIPWRDLPRAKTAVGSCSKP